MDNYEKEMFDFLTQEENLKGLIIAKNQFNSVSETLIKTLWDKVTTNLSIEMKRYSGWEVKSDKQLSDSHSKIYLYDKDLKLQKDGLPSMFFGWERLSRSYPYYGFYVNLASEDFKVTEMVLYLLDQKPDFAKEFKGQDGGWLFWDQDKQLDFNIDNTLINIIPAKVDEKAKELSDMLLDLFINMQDIYRFIKLEYKK